VRAIEFAHPTGSTRHCFEKRRIGSRHLVGHGLSRFRTRRDRNDIAPCGEHHKALGPYTKPGALSFGVI
jgi:hypothetical protein